MRVSLWLSALALFGVVACSSTPRTADTTRTDDRQDYITSVEKKLSDWEDKAGKLKGDGAMSVRADIADTRAELNAMRSASSDRWTSYRGRIDSRLDRLQTDYDKAKRAE